MKVWWLVALSVLTGTAAAHSAVPPNSVDIKDEEGRTVAVVVVCNECRSETTGAAKTCPGGVEQGWLNGAPCGKCMLEENAGEELRYAFDLHITGTLNDQQGQPVKQRFVKLFMANGWSVRTQTSDQGTFRVVLGAMERRTPRKALTADLGTRVDARPATGEEYFTLFMLPPGYKPCPPAAARPHPGKRKDRPART